MTQNYNHINTASIKPVRDFIADYSLKRADGVTAFTATIMYNDNGFLNTITSEVQIISIAETMAVYIYEFFKGGHRFQEMYSSENFTFGYNKGSALEISNAAMRNRLHIAITPLQ